jgi:hypothetical protein
MVIKAILGGHDPYSVAFSEQIDWLLDQNLIAINMGKGRRWVVTREGMEFRDRLIKAAMPCEREGLI